MRPYLLSPITKSGHYDTEIVSERMLGDGDFMTLLTQSHRDVTSGYLVCSIPMMSLTLVLLLMLLTDLVLSALTSSSLRYLLLLEWFRPDIFIPNDSLGFTSIVFEQYDDTVAAWFRLKSCQR